MRVEMKQRLPLHVVGAAIGAFQRMGFDVQAKNGDGRVILAILGLGADKIDYFSIMEVPGVAGFERKKVLLDSEYEKFQEAWIFLASEERKREKIAKSA